MRPKKTVFGGWLLLGLGLVSCSSEEQAPESMVSVSAAPSSAASTVNSPVVAVPTTAQPGAPATASTTAQPVPAAPIGGTATVNVPTSPPLSSATGGSAGVGIGEPSEPSGGDSGVAPEPLPMPDAGAPDNETIDFPAAAGTPTVYLAGDSTVQTYGAGQAPQQGWGQRLAEFFTDDVIIENRAIGGRSSKSYIDEGRLDEILEDIQAGDYLFAQWGINDRYTDDEARYTNPESTFRDYLRMYIDGARSKDAIPVLLTPTPRLDYSNGAFQNGFAAYCTAIHAVGEETDTLVIDLQSKGLNFYTSIGLEAVEADIALDVLHFKEQGAYEMARLVAEGVQEIGVPISQFVQLP